MDTISVISAPIVSSLLSRSHPSPAFFFSSDDLKPDAFAVKWLQIVACVVPESWIDREYPSDVLSEGMKPLPNISDCSPNWALMELWLICSAHEVGANTWKSSPSTTRFTEPQFIRRIPSRLCLCRRDGNQATGVESLFWWSLRFSYGVTYFTIGVSHCRNILCKLSTCGFQDSGSDMSWTSLQSRHLTVVFFCSVILRA